jgi:hypothetical protein
MESTDARLTDSCGSCRHFDNSPASFEQAFPGLVSFSSGSASVRGQDGICVLHERLVAARSGCKQHNPAVAQEAAPSCAAAASSF